METSHFDKIKGGVILTGGTSLIEGIDILAKKIFDLETIVDEPKNFKGNAGLISSPIYSTAVGLVYYGARVKRNKAIETSNIFKKILMWLKDRIDWY
jgi:cell division protein FtsA